MFRWRSFGFTRSKFIQAKLQAVEVVLSCEFDQSTHTSNMVKPMQWEHSVVEDHSYSLPIKVEQKSENSKREPSKKKDPAFIYL